MIRHLCSLVLATSIAIAAPEMVLAGPRDCWAPPVRGALLQPYDPPACTYCAGSHGIVLAAAGEEPVHAVADGTVTFAGTVAGTAYVVVEHADGVRITYGRLVSVAVRRGGRVVAGEVVGAASGELYVGLRDPDDQPLDPTPLLGRWRARPRLVPLDGSPRRPAAVALRCARGP